MNWLSVLVIGGIILLILFKNWDKVMDVIDRMRSRTPKSKETVELSKVDIETKREERLTELTERRELLLRKLKTVTTPISDEIKEIDAEMFLIGGRNV